MSSFSTNEICRLLSRVGEFQGQELLTDEGQPVVKNGSRVRILKKQEVEMLSLKVGWAPEKLIEHCLLAPLGDTKEFRVIGSDLAAFLSVKCCVERFAILWGHAELRLCLGMMQAVYREDDRPFLKVIAGTLSDWDTLVLLDELGKKRMSPMGELATPYRTDSLDTVLLHEWSQLRCRSFLKEVLGTSVSAVCQVPRAFEVDSEQLVSPMLLRGALQNVQAVCEEIVHTLGTVSIPLMLHRFLYQVACRYKSDADTSCNTIVVLRVLTPAILDPFKFGIVPVKLHKFQQRGLLIVAKVLQQIANGVPFRSGNSLMQLNSFIKDHHIVLRDTIRTFSMSQPAGEVSSYCPGKLAGLQKVLAHWPKYRKLTLTNLGFLHLDPETVDDCGDDVAVFATRFMEEAAPRSGTGSRRGSKKKLLVGSTLLSRSFSLNHLKRKQKSDPGAFARRNSIDNIDQSFESELEDSSTGRSSEDREGSSSLSLYSRSPGSTGLEERKKCSILYAMEVRREILNHLEGKHQIAEIDGILRKVCKAIEALEYEMESMGHEN